MTLNENLQPQKPLASDRYLKFKALNPNGKPQTWSKRNHLDKGARARARRRLQQEPEYLMADEEERQRMLAEEDEKTDDKRKLKRIHADNMFHGYGKPKTPVKEEVG